MQQVVLQMRRNEHDLGLDIINGLIFLYAQNNIQVCKFDWNIEQATPTR